MKVCPKCSGNNRDHYRFCLTCGEELPRTTEAPPSQAPRSRAQIEGATGEWYIFTPLTGARYLGWQHVAGHTMHIHWSSFASTYTPESIRNFYRSRHPHWVDNSNGFSLRNDTFILRVFSTDEPYPNCDNPPDENELSVIVVSKAIL